MNLEFGIIVLPPSPEPVRIPRRRAEGRRHGLAWFSGRRRLVLLQPNGPPEHFRFLRTVSTNARNSEQFEELIQVTLTVVLEEAIDGGKICHVGL